MFKFNLPEFVAHPMIRGGNAQTVLGAFLPAPREPDGTTTHQIPTTQQDALALHENEPVAESDSGRQVLLLHGLGGTRASGYMVRSGSRILESGYGLWRLDARGAGSGNRWARYHHHAGRSEDVQAAVDHIAKTRPDRPITIVGFSLGANVLLKWLDSTKAGPVDSAIAVAPPVDLFRCSDNLKSGLSRLYDLHFARMMVRRLTERRKMRPDMFDVVLPTRPDTLKQFDSLFTARAGGFTDLDDYYQTCSSVHGLNRIRIPTLLLVDESDPVIPIDMFHDVQLSSAVTFITTAGGGHLGYIAQKSEDEDRHWMSWRIAEAIDQFNEQAKSADE